MSDSSLTEPLLETLAVFDEAFEPLGTNEVAERLDLGRRSTYDRLTRLVDEGMLETKKVGASARVWWPPGTAFEARDSPPNDWPFTESERERYVRQEEVIASLGQRALEDRNLDALLDTAVEHVAAVLDLEYCKVLELDATGTELVLRQGTGWEDGAVGSATVSAVSDDTQAAYTLSTEQPVVVENQQDESRFCLPELLADHDVESGISTIIGSPDDPWGVLGTHDTSPKEYSERDIAFVQSVANILANAIDRRRFEQELLHQREQLTALDNLNTIVREITDAVIYQSTREEIETIVCDRLAASDSYLFAWIGDVDMHSQTVSLRAEAGVEGYLDGITISVDPDDERSAGPTGRAILQREIQVTNDFDTEHRHDPWRDDVSKYGFRSSAAIPIIHDETLYGVLNVYAERLNAFTSQERTVISQLGEIIGHAIAAVERKRALLSNEVVELEFRLQHLADALGIEGDSTGTVDFHQTVPLDNSEYLGYGTATGNGLAVIEALTTSEKYPQWDSVSILETTDDESRFEVVFTDPPVLATIASQGGDIRRSLIENGDYYMQVHLPTTVDIRQVVEAITDAYPGMEMVTQRNLKRNHHSEHTRRGVVLEELTDRQRATIQAAYHAGFYEWPRSTSGQDLAASMGVDSSTFHQHLRKAERKVIGATLTD
ncbi:Signal transduction regulator [Halanaeroarchaeum sp. HSR-CO]|uniref:bacterio-opsin activator domain-containing protein n=1 Tax=Halanaeroarchaeum sp. HSR-CO TaxID=2866382 RepID=UPI00217EBECC|nr:bacterio-opsin activator domain-containing protein [Halanaeroarchaeum sp. HSR-CO]UWG47701.1 Signal transduction regulator [Halanaeroarchaeum sp. HSR-CO]